MKFFNKTLATLAAVTAAILPSAFPAHAVESYEGMPLLMTLKTDIYNVSGPDNSFTIYLGATADQSEFYIATPRNSEYIDVDMFTIGKDQEGNNAVIATPVSLSVNENNNVIKLYGDPKTLDYIDIHGCYITEVDFNSEMTNLLVLDASHNYLSAIDLTALTSLQSIDLTDNAFTNGSQMKIGANHPYLEILSVGINDAIDPDLKLSNYPYLQYFSARNNYGLTSVDPSQCPNLVSLVLEVTNISSLDVSKNLKLDVLNISNTKINDIDLSKNVNLGEFYASHEGSYNVNDAYKFSKIDLSNNTKLQYLDLSGNKLTEIDLTNNPSLLLLYLQKNRLSEIDLSKNTSLATVNLSNNYFTFATLPLPREGWDYYYYRSPLPCYFKYRVGEVIDFSADVIREPYVDSNGNTITPATYANVWGVSRTDSNYEIDASLYTYADGKITFKEAIPDSVYVEFYCDAFPDWPMQSANFKIKTDEDYDAPSPVFSFTPAASLAGKTVSMKIGGHAAASGIQLPADITVKAGSETYVIEKAVTANTMPSAANVTFTVPAGATNVDILITDGFTASNLSVDNVAMDAVDLSEALNVQNLALTNCGLTKIDLGFNGALRTLNLSGNRLTRLDLSAVRGDYQKWNLTDVNVANNALSSVISTYSAGIRNFVLSNNLFKDFDFKYYTGLKNLDISNNQLSGNLDLSAVEAIETLNIASNNIESLTLGETGRLTTLMVMNNKFSFATLPIFDRYLTYIYVPQAKYSILTGGSAVNLSNQNVNGNTVYTWKYADTDAIVDSSLLTVDNGSTWFDKSLIGKKLYCEMTNPAFPNFASNPLTTTIITVQDKPSNLVASFTTRNDGEAQIGVRFATGGANAIYIDWYGDGSELQEYIYDDMNTSIYRTGTSHAGATARIYTFGDPSDVTCFFANATPMTHVDLTPMTKLQAVDIHDAGLTDGHLVLPPSSNLYELILDGNAFSTQSFGAYPRISNLNLAGNRYKEFDLSEYPNASFVRLSNNQLTDLRLGAHKQVYQLFADGNKLKEIDLTGVTGLEELILIDNDLTSIDLSGAPRLRTLQLEGNYFTFSTLPAPSAQLTWYTYGNQKPVPVQCLNGVVDLSSEHTVLGNTTSYRCFLGDKQTDVYYDYYMEEFVSFGELFSREDDPTNPEFTNLFGQLHFHYLQDQKVVAALTNAAYPNLILFTTPFEIDAQASVSDITVDTMTGLVDVYNLSGMRLRTGVDASEATAGLTPGLYILNDGHTTTKVLVK